MAYDEDLAQRIRALVATRPGLSEKKMFGGLAFLVGGNLAIARKRVAAASWSGSDLHVQISWWRPRRRRSLSMRGRPMSGWVRVDAADLGTARQLKKWVDLGVGFAQSLPEKG